MDNIKNNNFLRGEQRAITAIQNRIKSSSLKIQNDQGVIAETMRGIQKGKSANAAFIDACEEENFDGKNSAQARVKFAQQLKSRGINIDLDYVNNRLGHYS